MQNIPSTKEIYDKLIASFESNFGSTTPILPVSVFGVIAKIIAPIVALLYKLISWGILQQFVSTASFQNVTLNGKTISPLRELAGLVLPDPEPKPAQNAIIDIEITTLSASNDVLESGAQLISQSNQWVYTTVDPVDLSKPSPITAQVKATKDPAADDTTDPYFGGGAGGNLEEGSLLTFVSPMINVSKTAVVIGTSQVGADSESEEAYRARVSSAFGTIPQGGAIGDYRTWGLTVTGVFQIYPYTGIFQVLDSTNKTWGACVESYVQTTTDIDPDGIPPEPILIDVKNYLDTVAPVGVIKRVLPITRSSFDVNINGFNSQSPDSVKKDILAALTDYFLRIRPFIQGVDTIQKNIISTFEINQQVATICKESNSTFDEITVFHNDQAISGKYQVQAGELAKLGEINYT